MAKRQTKLTTQAATPTPPAFSLVGKRVTGVRAASEAEIEALGWEHTRDGVTIIQFSDGSLLFASQDEEMNGPGVIFVQDSKDTLWGVSPLTETGEVHYLEMGGA